MGCDESSPQLVDSVGLAHFMVVHEFRQEFRDCLRWHNLAESLNWILNRHHSLHSDGPTNVLGGTKSKNRNLPDIGACDSCNTTLLEMMKGSERSRNQRDLEMARLVQEFAEKLEHDPYQPGVVHPELYPDDLQEVIEDLFFVRGFSEASLRIVKNPDGMSIQVQVLERGGINNKNRPSSDETSKV